MKKLLFRSLFFAAAILGTSYIASAQIYVTVRPTAPVIAQTPRPGPTHVWIGEEWVENGHGYKFVGGHWEAPPRPGLRWVPGHWAHENRGHFWIRGHWA
jgi:hypothetical protein